MKQTHLVVTLCVAAVTLAGCGVGVNIGGPGGSTLAGKSQVRFAAAADDLPAFDVCLDGELAVRDVRFGEVADYGEVNAGSADLVAIDAGTSCSNAAGTGDRFSLGSGRDYTFLVLEAGEPAIQLVDDNSFVPVGRSRIRLINASPDSLALDVQDANGVTLLEDVRYNEPDDYAYIEVVDGDYDLSVVPLAGDRTPVELGPTRLADGMVYTLFATGLVEPDEGEAEFGVVLVEDAFPGIE